MQKLLYVLTATLLIACSHRTPVVQTGGPAPAAAKPAARNPDDREPFWSDTIRQWNTLSRGWNRIPGRFGTGCAHDTIYAFKVRPGLTDKVMIFLNGGGICWRSGTCDPRKPAAVMSADDPANDVSVRAGILDWQNDKNPVRDWTMVFVNYCTGDAHLGSSETEYARPGGRGDASSFKIRHGGAVNLEAVMDWVYVNLKRPSTIFVAGVDAGAIASPVVAAKMARHYRNARVVQLGDGAGSFRGDTIPVMMSIWGATDYLKQDPTYRSLDSAQATFQRLYTIAGRANPRMRFAQVNHVDDAVQEVMLGTLGVKAAAMTRTLATNLSELGAQTSWFRSYTAPGKTHTILRSNAMYNLKVDGTPFVSWLDALVNGEPLQDVGEKLLVEGKR
jgi:hypothetical protein